jgi:uncharacterized GH25 family protein
MRKMLKPVVLALALAGALAATSAYAHKPFLLPSSTVLSGKDEWVTVDAAVSNDLFYFNHQPMQLANLAVFAPDGQRVDPQNASTGRYRSTFDVKLDQVGTYKMAVLNNAIFGSYKVDGQMKRWRGNPENIARDIPANAQDVQISQSQMRLETFVTAGKPSSQVFTPTGVGLELQPITHPNDLVEGEATSFRLLLDGKPAAGVKVEADIGGTRYRDVVKEIEVTTDADGKFSITWPAPGMYWMGASVRDNNASIKEAKERRASYSALLEVLPK